MMEPVRAEYRDLFEKRSFGFVGTVLPDGAPHVTPTLRDFDGEHILEITRRGNPMGKNVRENPRIGLAIVDPGKSYR